VPQSAVNHGYHRSAEWAGQRLSAMIGPIAELTGPGNEIGLAAAGMQVEMWLSSPEPAAGGSCGSQNPSSLDRRPQMRWAAPGDREQGRAGSLQLDGVPRLCQNGRKTAVTSSHSQAPEISSDLGMCRSEPGAKRTPEQLVILPARLPVLGRYRSLPCMGPVPRK
jgi:hypothetical protein